ncbi:hypothetical protein QVD17_26196 [Tagetes erecta]|uniref:Uncharacterized protein n=1 Tax=Tagetes erecta TaxID=13708 RepID=A0AAD8K716_TARER|nr:hypothetical protein QVD17_26196 [Tagetes erecta]
MELNATFTQYLLLSIETRIKPTRNALVALTAHSAIILTTRDPKHGFASTMVCVACLLPLFLVPIVNLLPLLFDFIMARVYRVLGWEYRKPDRTPAACPYKPPVAAAAANNNTTQSVAGEHNDGGSDLNDKALPAKLD